MPLVSDRAKDTHPHRETMECQAHPARATLETPSATFATSGRNEKCTQDCVIRTRQSNRCPICSQGFCNLPAKKLPNPFRLLANRSLRVVRKAQLLSRVRSPCESKDRAWRVKWPNDNI